MQRRVDLDAWYVAHASLALDLKILAPHPAGSAAQQERAVMRAALSLPARYEASAPRTLAAANDSYIEVMVGGLTTACLSRDGLARMMLQDCLDARANPDSPSQAGLRLQRPCHRAGRP